MTVAHAPFWIVAKALRCPATNAAGRTWIGRLAVELRVAEGALDRKPFSDFSGALKIPPASRRHCPQIALFDPYRAL